MDWRYWWDRELDLDNPHIRFRMKDRVVSETMLREMLEAAHEWQPDDVPGRFAIFTRRGNDPWKVIVEPDESTHTLIVVTAHRIDADDML